MKLETVFLLLFVKKIISIPIMVKYKDIIIDGRENTFFTEIIQESPVIKIHANSNKEYANKDKIIIKIIASPQFLSIKPKAPIKRRDPYHQELDEEKKSTKNQIVVADDPSSPALITSQNLRSKRSTIEKRDLFSRVLQAFSGMGYQTYYNNYMRIMYPDKYKNVDRIDYGSNDINGYDAYLRNYRTKPRIVYGWIDKNDYHKAIENEDPSAIPWS